jgi:hypothetical protein
MRIFLDFDGVIHTYENGWTGPIPTDPPHDDALWAVHRLQDLGHTVVVFSARAKTIDGHDGITEWLKKHDFPALSVTCVKTGADIYVDDRGFRFEGDFAELLNFVSYGNVKPWNKK